MRQKEVKNGIQLRKYMYVPTPIIKKIVVQFLITDYNVCSPIEKVRR